MQESLITMVELLAQIDAAEQQVTDLEDDVQYIECCRHLPSDHPDHQHPSRLAPAKTRLLSARRHLDRLRRLAQAQGLDPSGRRVLVLRTSAPHSGAEVGGIASQTLC